MTEVERTGLALLRASEELEAALASDASESLTRALSARERCFADFEAACRRVAHDPPQVLTELAGRLRAADERLASQARRHRREISAELEALGAFRRARATERNAAASPRFLSRRV